MATGAPTSWYGATATSTSHGAACRVSSSSTRRPSDHGLRHRRLRWRWQGGHLLCKRDAVVRLIRRCRRVRSICAVPQRVSELRFGNFDNDRKPTSSASFQDAGRWYLPVRGSGTSSAAALTDSVTQLVVADFDGDAARTSSIPLKRQSSMALDDVEERYRAVRACPSRPCLHFACRGHWGVRRDGGADVMTWGAGKICGPGVGRPRRQQAVEPAGDAVRCAAPVSGSGHA